MLIISAYLFFFLASAVAPLQRRWLSVNREGENGGQIGFAFQMMLIIALLGSILPLFEPLRIEGDWWVLGMLSLACGGFGAGYWILSYTAQKHVDAGISSLVINIYTPVAVVLSTLWLGESLTGKQVLGAALLLIAILSISKKHHLGRFRFDKYFLMMLASGVMVGFLLTAERALQKTSGFSGGTLMSWWAQCVALGVVALLTKNRSQHTLSDTLITGVARFSSAFAWVSLVYLVGNLSLAASVSTFKVVVIFAAAALFLNEREDLERKLMGSLIAVAGLWLMK